MLNIRISRLVYSKFLTLADWTQGTSSSTSSKLRVKYFAGLNSQKMIHSYEFYQKCISKNTFTLSLKVKQNHRWPRGQKIIITNMYFHLWSFSTKLFKCEELLLMIHGCGDRYWSISRSDMTKHEKNFKFWDLVCLILQVWRYSWKWMWLLVQKSKQNKCTVKSLIQAHRIPKLKCLSSRLAVVFANLL